MEEVRLHTVGRIEHGGKYQGWYVFVQPFRNAGAYLILISNNEKFGKDETGQLIEGSVGYDDWVPDKETLAAYFGQYGWEINWLDEKKSAWLSDWAD